MSVKKQSNQKNVKTLVPVYEGKPQNNNVYSEQVNAAAEIKPAYKEVISGMNKVASKMGAVSNVHFASASKNEAEAKSFDRIAMSARADQYSAQNKAVEIETNAKLQVIKNEINLTERISKFETQRIQAISGAVSTAVGIGLQVGERVMKDAGVEQAKKDILGINAKIQAVELDDLSPVRKMEEIDELRGEMDSAHGWIYGKAYETVQSAYWTNAAKVDAKVKAERILTLVTGANGKVDINQFKEIWKEQTKNGLEHAPTDAAMVVAQDAYYRTGLDTFIHAEKGNNKIIQAESSQASKLAQEITVNEHHNAIRNKDIAQTKQTTIDYNTRVDSDVVAGRYPASVGDELKKNFKTTSYLSKVDSDFQEAISEGKGAGFYESFLKRLKDKDMTQYNHKVLSTMTHQMESQLKTQAQRVEKQIDEMIEAGIEPDEMTQNSMIGLTKVLYPNDPKPLAQLEQKLAAVKRYKHIEQHPISEQLKFLETSKAEINSPRALEAYYKLEKIVKKKLKDSKDPVALGQKEELFKTPVEVGMMSDPAAFRIRESNAMTASRKYDSTKGKYFTDSEVVTITNELNAASAEDKAVFYENLRDGAGNMAAVALDQLGIKNPSNKLAGEMVTGKSPEEHEVGSHILMGADNLKSENVAFDKNKVKKAIVEKLGLETSKDVSEAVLQYAASKYRTETELDVDTDKIDTIIDEVLGSKVKLDNNTVRIPVGRDKKQYKEWLEEVQSGVHWYKPGSWLYPDRWLMPDKVHIDGKPISESDSEAYIESSKMVHINGDTWGFKKYGQWIRGANNKTLKVTYKPR